MNPQPDPMIGDIFAFLLVVGVIFYTYKSYLEGNTININELDNFVIGYVEEPQMQTSIIEKHYETRKEIQPVKIIEKNTERVRTERVVETKPSFESQQLYVDCIDALVALGMKKREAKKKAQLVFSIMNPQPNTIQDFLKIALGMPS